MKLLYQYVDHVTVARRMNHEPHQIATIGNVPVIAVQIMTMNPL